MQETRLIFIARAYAALVGAAYIALGLWCAILPVATARFVGFELAPGAGQSEYLVVYGGLQIALGWLFVRPIWRPETTSEVIRECLIIHVMLVMFRTLSLELYANIPTRTMLLAGVEWVICLSSGWLFTRLLSQRPHEET